MPRSHVFAGPTLPAHVIRQELPTACIHPPVQHGDLLRPHFGAGDVVLIIDGYYHQAGAVRHKEILDLMASGVAVCGASSMGALRAAELAEFGMTGIGEVFRMYRDGGLVSDDEVALAHTEAPEFRPLSVALVNLRHHVAAARTAEVISAGEAAALVEGARSLHYPERSWPAVARRVEERSPGLADAVNRVRSFVGTNHLADVKTADAMLALRSLGSVRPRPMPWWHDDAWRSRYLSDWQATHQGSTVDGHFVSHAAVLRYRQLYDRRFPARWRQHALRRIAGTAEPTGRRLEARALAKAAVAGLSTGDAGWLTSSERRSLSAREAALVTLVRSYRPVGGISELTALDTRLLGDPAAARKAVARAYRTNAAVAARGPGQHIEHLNRDRLVEHLCATWRIRRPDPESVTAAARDHGFTGLAEAVEAARPYLLDRLATRRGPVRR